MVREGTYEEVVLNRLRCIRDQSNERVLAKYVETQRTALNILLLNLSYEAKVGWCVQTLEELRRQLVSIKFELQEVVNFVPCIEWILKPLNGLIADLPEANDHAP